MGLFSFVKKITKGIKKVVKKIGKGIKKVVKKVGKVIGKLGIVGQIGLAILMPYAAPMIGSALGAVGAAIGSTTVGSAIVSGVTKVVSLAGQFGAKVGSVFSSVTKGVSKFVGDFVSVGAEKLGLGNLTAEGGAKTFSEMFNNVITSASDVGSKASDIFKPSSYNWSKAVEGGISSATNMENAGYSSPQSVIKEAVEDKKDSLLSRVVEEGKEIVVDEVKERAVGALRDAISPQEEYQEEPYSGYNDEFENQWATLQNSSMGSASYRGMTSQFAMAPNALQYSNQNPIGGGAQIYNHYQQRLSQLAQPMIGA